MTAAPQHLQRIDFDDLEATVETEELARLAVTSQLQIVRKAEQSEEQARAAFGDALAVAARHLSFGEMSKLTGLDKAYLHRLATGSDLYKRDSDG